MLDTSCERIYTRAELLAMGYTGRGITAAVRADVLRRLRRDRYVFASDARAAEDASVRVGGRLTCVSLLAAWGVFVAASVVLHIHVDRAMSRMRAPTDEIRPLRPSDREHVALHWHPLRWPAVRRDRVDLRDALACAVRCQPPRMAVATVDSILHLRLLTREAVQEVFDALPARYAVIQRLSDPAAESGPETFMRLLLRRLGVRYRCQVRIEGVGRVDFLVEDWLIVECDSRAFHEGWAQQLRDRRRDLAAAERGFVTLRPVAQDLYERPEAVAAAVRGALIAR